MLQKTLALLTATVILGIFPQDVLALKTAEVKIQKFELKNCNAEKKCIRILADHSESSQFVPIYILSNFSVQIINEKSTRILDPSSGFTQAYIDFNQDLVLLTQKNGADYTIDLKNLEEKDFSK